MRASVTRSGARLNAVAGNVKLGGGAGGLLILLVIEVVQDFVHQQSLHSLTAHINNAFLLTHAALCEA